MKNLFLIPTDKPSRLYQLKNDILRLDRIFSKGTACKNIYITFDEEIKTGDYYQSGKFIWQMRYPQWGEEGQGGAKKIILTTDPELIADGVQAIDDTFLEWFVKNPSCDEVEIDCWNVRTKDKVVYEPPLKEYEIIIPQEELKQETNDSSLKLLQVMELVELALQNGSIHPGSFIIRNAVRECIGLEPIK
jgi:hypothetical protein